MYIVLMAYIRVHFTFTVQRGSIFPMGLAPTASSTCPSPEEIDILHRNAKHLLEEMFHTIPCSCGGADWTRVDKCLLIAYFVISQVKCAASMQHHIPLST